MRGELTMKRSNQDWQIRCVCREKYLVYASVSEEASLNLEQPHVGASVVLEVNHTLSFDGPQAAVLRLKGMHSKP